jgi:DNA polymerase elongation subunit (family B)
MAKNKIDDQKTFDFQAFAWYVDDGTTDPEDYDNMDFTVRIFGKTKGGKSVAVQVKGYHPYFCVRFDERVADSLYYENIIELLESYLAIYDGGQKIHDYADHRLPVKEKILYRKSLWGYQFGKKLPFFQFSFRSIKAYQRILSVFRACQKNHLTIQQMQNFFDKYTAMGSTGDFTGDRDEWRQKKAAIREEQNEFLNNAATSAGLSPVCLRWIVKLGKANLPFEFAQGKLFEVIDPILRFAHFRNLKMAGWIRLHEFTRVVKPGLKTTTCSEELVAKYENISSIECDDLCPTIKEMSFDIEAYSYNDLFPDPLEKENYAYQIGVTMKYYADKGFHRRILHCRTPKELRENSSVGGSGGSGLCSEIQDIPSCLRSQKPLETCEKEDCGKLGHDPFIVKTRVDNFETEKELLEAFADMIVKEDPDIMYAYNSDIFDWNYLMVRAQVTGCMQKFSKISRLKNYRCKVESKAFNSSAYGDNKYLRVDVPGRLNIDLMIWVQRNMPSDRYPSYSLDTVAEKEIDENKRDVDAKEIFAAFRSGDPDQLTRVADYCCQDTVLVQKLVNKLDVLTQMFEMSNITDTPPMYLLQKGQQIKCFSQLSKEAREKDFLIPLADDREDGKFKGAIVLEPLVGRYDTPVSVLDFASLYPSIQMACSVCYTTIVLDQDVYSIIKKKKDAGDIVRVKNLDLVLYNGTYFDLVEWDEEIIVYHNKETGVRTEFGSLDDAKKITPKKNILENIKRNDDSETVTWRKELRYHSYAFAQKQPGSEFIDASGSRSVIPDLQTRLKSSRKAVKAMMAPLEHSQDPDDQLKYRVLNGRQLAIKVSMNSLYGFTSAFMLNLMALSASVTAKGRQMIERSKLFVETEFNDIARKTLWTEEDYLTFFTDKGKQVRAFVQGEEWVFGFKKGDKIIETSRGPIGVIPKDWIKKYPIAEIGKPWTMKNLAIQVVGGDSVTGDTPILYQNCDGTVEYTLIENLGFGDWQERVDGKEYQMCNHCIWSDMGFTFVKHIIRHKTDKRMFRVFTRTGVVDVTEDHSLLRPDGERVKPKDVHIGDRLLHVDLPSMGDDFGSLMMQNSIRFTAPDKLSAAQLYHHLSNLGCTVTFDNDENGFSLECIPAYPQLISDEKMNEIIKIVELPREDRYVYDLETENHHFHVGPGRLVVHNTDSIFTNYPNSSLAEAISLSHKASDILTDEIFNRHPIEMEYEKTYLPLFIQKKKNYIGKKYEMDDQRWKIDYKGIAIKRRNYCNYVKTVFWSIIYPALGVQPIGRNKFKDVEWDVKLGPEKALEALRENLRKLTLDQIEIDDLVISASLKSTYKGPTCTGCKGGKTLTCENCKGKKCEQCRNRGWKDCPVCGGRGIIVNLPHIQLAKRMKERDEGSAPISGQRFGYIVVNDDSRPAELSARTEDPKFAKKTGLKPDYIYYLDQQVRKPIVKFMTLVGREKETEEIFLNMQNELFNILKNQRAKREVEARRQFFDLNTNGKRMNSVEPLKAPKKTTVSREQKKENFEKTNKSINTFFKKKV